MDNLKVITVRDKMSKFECFKIKIGAYEERSPLKWLLMSEIPKLEDLLRRAYELGREDASQAALRLQTHEDNAG